MLATCGLLLFFFVLFWGFFESSEVKERTVERMENWGGLGHSRKSSTISNSVYFITLNSIRSTLKN